jgi:hypothetical protein
LITDLETGLDHVRQAPRDRGLVELIVCRPAEDERLVLEEARLSRTGGLIGDNWQSRVDADGAPNLDAQLTVMSARYVDLIAGGRDRWPLAGDQLYVDLDLSIEHLPPGTRLGVGSAIIEVSELPHTGCDKFSTRFGRAALRLANSQLGRGLRLRGLNAKIVEAGTVRHGDPITRL